MDRLDEREWRILHMRFVQEKTQADVGVEIGCSQVHISRLLTRTLTTLRRGMLHD